MNILAPLITLPLVVRALGSDGMGKIAIASSILSYFMILGSSGLTSFGNRLISKEDDNLDLTIKFSRVFNLQVIYTTISILLFLLYIFTLGIDLKIILLISIIQLVSSYFDFTWFFYGINEIKSIAIRNIFIKFLGIISIYLYVNKPEDIINYLWILGLSSLFANISILFFLIEKIEIKRALFYFRLNISDIKSSLFIILPLFIMAIYSNIDRFIIYGFLKKFDEVGIYDVGMKIISIFAILIISLRPIMISKISKNITDVSRIEFLVTKSISLVFYISIPIIILLNLNIEKFISLFLGNKFIDSAIIIRILSIQILFTGIGDIFVNQILISMGKEKKILKIITILCLILVSLYITLVPIFGIYGASFGSVIAHFIILFLEFNYVKKYINIKIDQKEIYKLIAAGLSLLLFIKIVYLYFNINTYLELGTITIIGLIIYFLMCFVLKLKLQQNIFLLIFNFKN